MTNLKPPRFNALDDDVTTVEILVYRLARRGQDNTISHAWILSAAPYVRAHHSKYTAPDAAGLIQGHMLYATITDLIRSGHEPTIRVRSVDVVGFGFGETLPEPSQVETWWRAANRPPPLTVDTITDRQIHDLRLGADIANNDALIQLCDQALTPISSWELRRAKRLDAREACAAHINALEVV